MSIDHGRTEKGRKTYPSSGKHDPKPGESKPGLAAAAAATAQTTGTSTEERKKGKGAELFYPQKMT